MHSTFIPNFLECIRKYPEATLEKYRNIVGEIVNVQLHGETRKQAQRRKKQDGERGQTHDTAVS